jgi:hypothetical protein
MYKPATLKAKLLNTKITIYGEDHSKINNGHYEGLNLSGILLVEHSTNACEIKPEQEHLFQQYAKGSEWVFYTQKKIGNPNVICFDTRNIQGYLNALEEVQMLENANKLSSGNPAVIRSFIDMGIKSMIALSNNKSVFVEDYFVESLEILDGQLKAIIKLLKIRKDKGIDTTVLGMPLEELLSGLAHTYASNLRRIASVSVDMYLMKLLIELAENNEREIQVFCGKNHLIRMSRFLPLTNVRITGITRSLQDNASIKMEGDREIDEKIIALDSQLQN